MNITETFLQRWNNLACSKELKWIYSTMKKKSLAQILAQHKCSVVNNYSNVATSVIQCQQKLYEESCKSREIPKELSVACKPCPDCCSPLFTGTSCPCELVPVFFSSLALLKITVNPSAEAGSLTSHSPNFGNGLPFS
jgi:hypothetical protein